jgi:hypothetical protein
MTIASDIFLAARGVQDTELIEGFDILKDNLKTKKILNQIESFKNKIPKDLNESRQITNLLNKKNFELFETGKNILQNDFDTISLKNIDGTKQNSITLFKKIYKRHSNFVKNIKYIDINEGTPYFGQTINFKIKHTDADLLNGIVLQIITPKLDFYGLDNNNYTGKFVDKIGIAMLEEINLYFGDDMLLDSLNGEIINLINEINLDTDTLNSYNNLIGHNKMSIINNVTIDPKLLLIPLPFWFTRHIYNALPLCAMDTFIKLEIKFKNVDNLIHKSSINSNILYKIQGNFNKCKLLLETITLNKEEKKLMSSIEHKYLITQYKKKSTIVNSANKNFSLDIDFGNDLKELIWIGKRADSMKTEPEFDSKNIPLYNNHFDYLSKNFSGFNMFKNFSIYEKSELKLDKIEPQFFNMFLPYKFHKRTPSTGIFIYNYAEKPNEEQPSGSYNGINNLTLKGEFNDSIYGQVHINVYGACYNILTINSKNAKGKAKLKVGYHYKNKFD